MNEILNSHTKSQEFVMSNESRSATIAQSKGMKILNTKDLEVNDQGDSSTNRYKLDTGRLDQEAEELRQMLSDYNWLEWKIFLNIMDIL